MSSNLLKRKCENMQASQKHLHIDPSILNENLSFDNKVTSPSNLDLNDATSLQMANENASFDNKGLLNLNDATSSQILIESLDMKNENCLLPTDTDSTCLDNFLTSFFQDENAVLCNEPPEVCEVDSPLKPHMQQANSLCTIELSSNIIIFQKDLKNFMFLSVELYNGQFKVFLKYCKSGEMQKKISMSLITWYDFCKKIHSLNLIYASSSFVANNKIIVLNSKSEIFLKMINKNKLCKLKLNENQFELLKLYSSELNQTVIQFMFNEYLPYLVKQDRRYLSKCQHDENLLSSLCTWIEHDLIRIFLKIFECNQCKKQEMNQQNHECHTLSNFEKYNRLGFNVLMLCNIQKIVTNFLDHIDFVTEEFLINIDVASFCNILFKRN